LIKLFSGSLLALFLANGMAMAATPTAPRPPALQKPPVTGAVRIQVENGLFHVLDDVMMTVKRLDGWMIPKPGQMVSLDQKTSFTLDILSGETRLKAEDLSRLSNEYLLPHAKTPIKNLVISFDGGVVAVKGDLHKGMDLPFSGRAALSLDPTGDIRLHFTELKVAGMIKKNLLDLLGIKLSSVAQPEKESRFHIEGDDILLPIAALFPPPRIQGKLTSVKIEGDEMVQTFGTPNTALKPPPTAAKNYIYFYGGRIKLGKLTMDDVDLELVDKNPATGFDFSLEHYQQQLEAGYSKSLPSLGLVVYMPDYSTVASKK
jgi:hypothetical protein